MSIDLLGRLCVAGRDGRIAPKGPDAPWYSSPTSKVQTNGTATISIENDKSLLITVCVNGR